MDTYFLPRCNRRHYQPPFDTTKCKLDSIHEIIRIITLSGGGGGHAVAQLVEAASQKVAGSTRDRVFGIFHLHNPSGSTVTLGSTQPLTEISTRNIYWGKGGRCVRLTTLPSSRADCLEIWEPQPPRILAACPGVYRHSSHYTK